MNSGALAFQLFPEASELTTSNIGAVCEHAGSECMVFLGSEGVCMNDFSVQRNGFCCTPRCTKPSSRPSSRTSATRFNTSGGVVSITELVVKFTMTSSVPLAEITAVYDVLTSSPLSVMAWSVPV